MQNDNGSDTKLTGNTVTIIVSEFPRSGASRREFVNVYHVIDFVGNPIKVLFRWISTVLFSMFESIPPFLWIWKQVAMLPLGWKQRWRVAGYRIHYERELALLSPVRTNSVHSFTKSDNCWGPMSISRIFSRFSMLSCVMVVFDCSIDAALDFWGDSSCWLGLPMVVAEDDESWSIGSAIAKHLFKIAPASRWVALTVTIASIVCLLLSRTAHAPCSCCLSGSLYIAPTKKLAFGEEEWNR